MTSTVLVTGAATGIGNLTARRLAQAGHTVYASMLDPGDEHGRELRALAASEGLDLRTVELDDTFSGRLTLITPPSSRDR